MNVYYGRLVHNSFKKKKKKTFDTMDRKGKKIPPVNDPKMYIICNLSPSIFFFSFHWTEGRNNLLQGPNWKLDNPIN